MNKTYIAISMLTAAISIHVSAEQYDFNKFSVSSINYDLEDDISGNAIALDARVLNNNVIYQASYSSGDLEDIDIDQAVISVGYALSNTKDRLTALGISVGRAEASFEGYSMDNNYQALNLLHSYRATDNAELNLRASYFKVNDSANYKEFEISASYFRFREQY